MQKVKRRIFSGVVCEQEVFNISARIKEIKHAAPRMRFRDEGERAKHREGISRRKHARLINENFSAASLYCTLTLDDAHEVHTFSEAKKIRDRYIRRLKYDYPDAVIFAYLGRGKSTHRIHMHMLVDGVPPEVIRKKWGQGSVLRVDRLREHNYYNGIDHGQDYTGLANYLFDHWTPEQGGHRWKQTKNARRPDIENAKPVRRAYSESRPPAAPKGYILVETRGNAFSYLYYKYIKCPDKPETNKNENRKS